MEIGWDSIRKQATRKVVLCRDRSDKEDWLHALKRALDRDKSYISRDRNSKYELLVIDTILKVSFLVDFYSTNQWSWADKTRGLIYDEVLVTGRGKRMEYPENLPNVINGRRRNGTISEMSLYLLTQNDQKIATGLGSDIAQTTAFDGDIVGTMSEDFDFPVSLFRRGMASYFEDFRRPTREEFLFALMMENVSGSTSREKKAIEEANLYVQSKGG